MATRACTIEVGGWLRVLNAFLGSALDPCPAYLPRPCKLPFDIPGCERRLHWNPVLVPTPAELPDLTPALPRVPQCMRTDPVPRK